MKGKLGAKLVVWSAVAIFAAFALDVELNYFGWENTPAAVIEAVLTASLMALLYLLMRKYVIRPMEDIEDTARRIMAGDLSARSHITSSREMMVLSETLNNMVEKMAFAYEQAKASALTLEKAVEARTKAVVVERDKLSAMFKSIPDGVIYIGITGEILEVNPMMEDIWGMKAGELLGRTVEELPAGLLKDSLTFKCKDLACKRCWEYFGCTQKDCPAYMSSDIRCWLISGTYCHQGIQVSVKRKREDVCSQCALYREIMDQCAEVREVQLGGRYYKITSSLVLEKPNRVLGEIKTFSDVTEEKLLEKRKADFISLVTHDLKSPLTSILGYTDLLLDGGGPALPEEMKGFVQSIRQSGKRLLNMVEQYLDLSKIEAGMLEIKKSPVLLSDILDEAMSELDVQAREKGITVEADIDPGLRPFEADKDKIVRVVSNLVSNAIKYTPQGGHVTVTGREVKDDSGAGLLEIGVFDTGYGIPPEDLPHVFDRYYRSNKAQAKGAGLGLAVVKSLVEMHKGTVAVESHPGKGSAFRVRIPIGEKTEGRKQ